MLKGVKVSFLSFSLSSSVFMFVLRYLRLQGWREVERL